MDTINIIERLSSLIEGEKRKELSEYGLQPVHLDILLYLKRCNRFSDSPLAIADYLNLTKGTVSQSIKNLTQKEFIYKTNDAEDKRVVHLALSMSGEEIVTQLWPPNNIAKALDSLASDKHESLQVGLVQLLKKCQQENSKKAFGQCKNCIHNLKQADHTILCGLTKQTLSTDDIELICKEFSLNTITNQ